MKKTFCIFGATSGIGLDFVKKNIKRNKVYCIGQNFTELDKFVNKNNYKKNYIKIKTDLSKNNAFNIYKKIKNNLDLILVSSGKHVNRMLVHFDNGKDYDEILNINLNNPFKIISKLYSLNKINDKANIIFIGSINGISKYLAGSAYYGISKSALTTACIYMAQEMARNQIKVNSISPAMVKTPLLDKASHLSSINIKNDKKRYLLSKDYLSTHEIINLIDYLISKKQKNITGQNFVIDSGYTISH